MPRIAASLAVCASLSLATAALAADWTQWRGPKRDGSIPGFKAPAQWPAQLQRSWKVEVGIGHASPLVVEKAVYVFSREGDREVARSLDLSTGRELWKESYPAPYEMHPAARGHGEGPKSTPLYAGGRLFTLGISGILSALDAESGRVLWRKDFSQAFQKTSPLYGTATSPVLVDGLLVAYVGGHDSGALIAFDPRTGAERWRWSEDGPGYTSPVVARIGGVTQLITQSQKRCLGLSPRDGKLLWSMPFTTPFDQNSISPVVAGDLVVFGGTRQPTFALRLKQEGGAWKAEKAWETRDVTLYMSTPVLSDGRLYGMSERYGGQLFILDAATGKTLFTGAPRLADNAAVLDAGAVLLVLTTDGDLRVHRKETAGLPELARYDVGESATWASPAISGKNLLVKDATTLHLWKLP